MRTFIVVFVLLCTIALSHTEYVGDANGHYSDDGTVPKDWTCNSLWFNEYARIKSGYYVPFEGRNLTKLFGAPIGTEIPTLDSASGEGTWGCDCNCGVWDPDCAYNSRNTGAASDADLARMWCSTNRADSTETDPVYTICQAVEDRASANSKHATCTSVPDTWFCEANAYDEASTGSGNSGKINCDCGCGAYDPDCDVFQSDSVKELTISCGRDLDNEARAGDKICIRGVAQCLDVPSGWTCDPHLYDEVARTNGKSSSATCDCFCGVWDPDCEDQATTSALPLNCGDGADSGAVAFCSKARASCVNAPQNWNCPPSRWAERYHQVDTGSNVPVCDCNCGDWDPDCDLNVGMTFVNADGGLDTVNRDIAIRCTEDAVAEHRDSNGDRHLCAYNDLTCQTVPGSWICTPRWYNEFATGSVGFNDIIDCDCGCGILDPDCLIDNDGEEVPLWCSNVAPDADEGKQSCNKKKVNIKREGGFDKEIWGICD